MLTDLEERFKTVVLELIAKRQSAEDGASTDSSDIDRSLQIAVDECQQKPWQPRHGTLSTPARSRGRPSTAPVAGNSASGNALAPPKTAPPALKKSPSILQLQAERDRLRRNYYEQVRWCFMSSDACYHPTLPSLQRTRHSARTPHTHTNTHTHTSTHTHTKIKGPIATPDNARPAALTDAARSPPPPPPPPPTLILSYTQSLRHPASHH